MEQLNVCPICRKYPEIAIERSGFTVSCEKCEILIYDKEFESLKYKWNHLKFIDYDDFIDDYSCFD